VVIPIHITASVALLTGPHQPITLRAPDHPREQYFSPLVSCGTDYWFFLLEILPFFFRYVRFTEIIIILVTSIIKRTADYALDSLNLKSCTVLLVDMPGGGRVVSIFAIVFKQIRNSIFPLFFLYQSANSIHNSVVVSKRCGVIREYRLPDGCRITDGIFSTFGI